VSGVATTTDAVPKPKLLSARALLVLELDARRNKETSTYLHTTSTLAITARIAAGYSVHIGYLVRRRMWALVGCVCCCFGAVLVVLIERVSE